MVRRANKKQRRGYSRKERKVILVATEGNNKTERTYFSEFNRMQKEWHIVPTAGNSTDPVGIIKDAIRTMNNRGINIDYGDSAFAVFDTDFGKEKQIADARKIARKNGVELALSNPCFEVWLLQHFRYSTRGYGSNDDVVSELKNRWPDYHKNIASFHYLSDRTGIAIDNSKKLLEFHETVNRGGSIENMNPSSDVYKLVEIIMPKGDDEKDNE